MNNFERIKQMEIPELIEFLAGLPTKVSNEWCGTLCPHNIKSEFGCMIDECPYLNDSKMYEAYLNAEEKAKGEA